MVIYPIVALKKRSVDYYSILVLRYYHSLILWIDQCDGFIRKTFKNGFCEILISNGTWNPLIALTDYHEIRADTMWNADAAQQAENAFLKKRGVPPYRQALVIWIELRYR